FLKRHKPSSEKAECGMRNAESKANSSIPNSEYRIPNLNGPDAILFNGGVFQPQVLQQRVLDVMVAWYDTSAQSWSPLVLTNPSLDLAVAWGAASFAWLRHSGGRRIGGGIPRSYYIGVEQGEPGALATGENVGVLCVAPQHLDEGAGIELMKPVLELALGQPVQFPLFSSTV